MNEMLEAYFLVEEAVNRIIHGGEGTNSDNEKAHLREIVALISRCAERIDNHNISVQVGK